MKKYFKIIFMIYIAIIYYIIISGSAKPIVNSGNYVSSQQDIDSFTKQVEYWKEHYPDKFNYLLRQLNPVIAQNYTLPAVWVYYPSNNTTVSRSQEVELGAYVLNNNPIEIRRVLYLYLELEEPGSNSFTRINSVPKMIQVNEYESSNISVRLFPELTDFKWLKGIGPVKIRIRATDGQYTWYSSDTKKDYPKIYSDLVLNISNNPPSLTNISLFGPFSPRYNDPIIYEAEVKDPDGDLVNVTLHILDAMNNETLNVTTVTKTGKVAFKAADYVFFDKSDSGKNFTYYYTFDDGIASNTTHVMVGPHLRRSPRLWVENPKVIPEDENYYWWQNYNFSINMKNQDPEDIEVKVDLFTDTVAHPWKLIASRFVRLTKEPQIVYFNVKPFDASEANQTFRFRFEYSEYNQYQHDYSDFFINKSINSRLIPYSLYSPGILFNILLLLLLSIFGGIAVERAILRRGGR